MDGRMDGRTDGRTDGRMDGLEGLDWMDGWIGGIGLDGWMDEWMDMYRTYTYIYIHMLGAVMLKILRLACCA